MNDLTGEGPIVEFAKELRRLHVSGGSLTSKAMEQRSAIHPKVERVGAATFTDAMRGDRFPTWRTVEAFVIVCKGNSQEWGEKWRAAKEEVERARGPQPSAEAVVPHKGDEGGAEDPREERSRLPVLIGVGGIVALVILGVGWYVTSRLTDDEGPVESVITVQNKSAIGTQLVEDDSPAFLQTEPLTGCRARGCVVAGSDVLYSGDPLVARCWTRGADFTNSDLTSPGIENNPGKATSDLWYWASMTGGISGYITEVYVVPEDRGGLGLPRCSESPVPASSIVTTPEPDN